MGVANNARSSDGCANGMCPAGITTQNDFVARRLMTLKKGRPSDAELPDTEEERYEDAKNGVMRYLVALAGELRGLLASMGLRHPRELVGRVDKLEQRHTGDPRKDKVDLSELLIDIDSGLSSKPRQTSTQHRASALNARMCADAASGAPLQYDVANGDRAIGATLAGKIALGEIEAPPEGFAIALSGYAGQALGFAMTEGMRIELTGFANDSPAEAMGGGVLVIRPPRAIAEEQRTALSVCGNAAGYGATGGALFVEGRAGQRVGVRNSGATIVVEGAGKYAFEYMTGGVGVVLGSVRAVIGSGMTGGVVYLHDDKTIAEKVHQDAEMRPLDAADVDALRLLVSRHAKETGSFRARSFLADGLDLARAFVKVVEKSS